MTPTATLFVQFQCKNPPDSIVHIRRIGAYAGALSCLTIFFLYSFYLYNKGMLRVQCKEWDFQTVTTSDYGIRIKLTVPQIEKIEQAMSQDEAISYGIRMKKHIVKNVECMMNENKTGS